MKQFLILHFFIYLANSIFAQGITKYGQSSSINSEFVNRNGKNVNNAALDLNGKIIAVTDIDGNTYSSITIGTQTWLRENLKTTHYNNGDPILTTLTPTLNIDAEINPKYQWPYDGKEVNVKNFGRLYTWYAATDSRNLCPTGWHLPSGDEWVKLEIYLQNNDYNYNGVIDNDNNRETNNYTAKALATANGWISNTDIGTVGNTDFELYRNKSGFNAKPGGYRNRSGVFSSLNWGGGWWSSTMVDDTFAWRTYIHCTWNFVYRDSRAKCFGWSIRCLKD
jgi:uncharacterized protein (TIGR02145 family)